MENNSTEIPTAPEEEEYNNDIIPDVSLWSNYS